LATSGVQGQSKAAGMKDSDEVCGCNGVCKGTIVKAIKDKGLFTLDEVKKHTKAASSCGSCSGLVEQILMSVVGTDFGNAQNQGRVRLYRTQPWRSAQGHPRTAPADPCRGIPLSGMAHPQWLRHLPPGHQLLPAVQLAARGGGRPAKPLRQRTGARQYPEGRHLLGDSADEGRRTTASELRRIADVADKYQVPMVKVTGGQRIDLLGVKKEDLVNVWQDLGMQSGHAYGKSIRTVKTCVGSEFCRFGTQNSTQMGIDLETMLANMWSPHKVKLAVSGCPRNCAEAGIKDVGVIAVDSGWELYVGGNGGIKTEVAQFCAR
jgi:nitrite reductase (NADH) large subunit